MRISIVIDCADTGRLAEFWAAALRYRPAGALAQYRVLVPADGANGPNLVLQQTDDPRLGKNRLHLDLHGGPIEAEVARLQALGATTDGDVVELDAIRWVVMQDPEGNEFCVVNAPEGP